MHDYFVMIIYYIWLSVVMVESLILYKQHMLILIVIMWNAICFLMIERLDNVNLIEL